MRMSHVDVNHENPLEDVHVTTRSNISESDVRMRDQPLYEDCENHDCNENESADEFVDTTISNKKCQFSHCFKMKNYHNTYSTMDFPLMIATSHVNDKKSIILNRVEINVLQTSMVSVMSNIVQITKMKRLDLYCTKKCWLKINVPTGENENCPTKGKTYKRACKEIFCCKNVTCLATM